MTVAAVADRVAGMLTSRIGRRGFLTRSTVVGSALAAHPLSYVLQPATAYAAICNCRGTACECGAACCDGYTEFCCTITGENRCPAGTIVAGWWKADTSPRFCNGPRYYLDCNAGCSGCGCGPDGICGGECSGTGCGCAGGDCGNRAAGCNRFRYGQCNQDVRCVGPIVCRVVTCVPPWAIEPTCSTVVRVDEHTAEHDRPCLHQVTGSVDALHSEGDTTTVAGWALDADTQEPVVVQALVNGVLAAETVAGMPRPDVGGAYPGYGAEHGFVLAVAHPGPAHQLCVVALNGGYGEGSVQLACRDLPARLTGTPYGSLDVAAGGRRAVRVGGWVLDPDRPEATAVHVYVDGQFAGSGLANGLRPDVGRDYPRSGPVHGFDLTVPAPAGDREVCVYGLDIDGGSPSGVIGCRRVAVADGAPFGHVDHLSAAPGVVHLAGWALDPDATEPVPIHVYSGSLFLGAGMADRPRPDVGAAHPGLGAAHGFVLAVPVEAGSHLIRTYAVDIAGSDANPLIDERWVDVPAGPPAGGLDVVEARAGAVRVAGWAAGIAAGGAAGVDVYLDDRLAGTGIADRRRAGAGRAAAPPGAEAAFDLVVPAGSGTHVVRAHIARAGGDGGPGPGSRLGSALVVVP